MLAGGGSELLSVGRCALPPIFRGLPSQGGKPVFLLRLMEAHCSGTRRGRRKGRAALHHAATLYIINEEGNGIESTL